MKCNKCGIKIYYSGDNSNICQGCLNKIDNINPSHYKKGKIEVADFIADQKMDYFEGNCCKYLCRYKYKNGVEDLEKAKWYLNKLIEREEGKS